VYILLGNEEFLDPTSSSKMNRFHSSGTSQIDPKRRKLIRRAKMKSLRISMAIVVTFLICWIPNHVMMIFFIFIFPEMEVCPDILFILRYRKKITQATTL